MFFDLALIIPCYNEEKRISKTFQAYYNYFIRSDFFINKKVAIILVNDGSEDKTAEIIKAFESKSNDHVLIKSITYEQNKGKGGAIKQGVQTVEAKIYGFTDADLSYFPESIDKVFQHFSDYQIIAGQRELDKQKEGYSKFREIGSNISQRIVAWFSGLSVKDTQCGFKFFTKQVAKEVLPKVKQERFSFDVEFLMRAEKQNYKIKSLPVNFQHDKRSTISWKDGFRYILDLLAISEQLKTSASKKFFWGLFGISVIISLAVFGWTIFKGYFFSDDFTWLWHGQKIDNDIVKIFTFRMSTFYSPVLNAFYSLMYSVFGYAVQVYFLIGVFVHVLVSYLSGVLTWQLSKSKLISLFTVVLVALVGGAYEPLVWIGANMHSIAALFVLLCLIYYYKYLEKNLKRYLIISLVSFVLALLSKEVTIVTVVVLLCLLVYKKLKDKVWVKQLGHFIFWLLVLVISSLYGWQQYIWQKSSVWVEAGVWQIDLKSIFKFPLVIFDIFIPISFLKDDLTMYTALLLWVIALVFLVFILIKYRRLKLVWLGIIWLILFICPTIFFQTEHWWYVLASRYTYLPRIGMVIIIAGIFRYHIVKNTARYIINAFVIVILLVSIVQIVFMAQTISKNYDYVYNTGRTLVKAMEQIKEIKPDYVLVRWDYPFTNNKAHIVGAASTVAGINEEKIIFLTKAQSERLAEGEVLLYWNAQKRTYEISQAIN